MPRVLAVNNYPTGDRFKRVVDALRGNGADVAAAGWGESSPSRFDSFDGVVLSGSPDMLSERAVQEKYRGETAAMAGSKVPVLGICFGHQLMARAFGAEVVKDGRQVKAMVNTTVLVDDPLFEGLPRSLTLLESREEVVGGLPEGFRLIARSETTEIAAMKHPARPLYGVAFHPERYTEENPDGNAVVGNFVRMLE